MIFFCRNKKSFSSAKKAIRDNSCTFEMTDRTRSILAFARSKSFIIKVSDSVMTVVQFLSVADEIQ